MPPPHQPMYFVQDVPVRYKHLSNTLRVLCLFPAVWGVYNHLAEANSIDNRHARTLDPTKSSALDNYVGILWCLLAGLWTFWLTNNLIRRWFIHYEPWPAMIRLLTLGTIFWFSVMYFVSYFGVNEPIWPWMVICAILAVAQTIQILHFRARGLSSSDGKKPRRDGKSLIYRTVLIPGGIITFITMVMLLHQNNMRPSSAEAIATGGATGIMPTSDAKLVIQAAQIQVLIIILSSWTPKALQRRQEIRDTTLRLAPPNSSKFAYTYKFVLGEAPSNHAKNSLGPKISQEMQKYDDLLLLPVSDAEKDQDYKSFKALEWSNRFKFDFLCKTEDDVFVRWDTVAQDLIELGPSQHYWRGFAFWAMEPIGSDDAVIENRDARRGIDPPFVSSTMYTLSRDVVTLLTYPGPRIFTKNEAQNIGNWLYTFDIKPVHDRRVQQWDVCENDMIAKRFSDSFKPLESMEDMYKNVIENRPLCTGFRQERCAPCYSCSNRVGHWKQRGLTCDSSQGISLIRSNSMDLGTTVNLKDTMPGLASKPKWIIPGILSDTSSIYSDTDEWVRLHWAIWTTDPAKTWKHRHYQAVETVFLHNPNAVLIVLSNTLPSNFFSAYTRQGYQIHIMAVSKELLLHRKWFFSAETEEWIRRWEEWSKKSPYFPIHLADYIRLVAIYKYGGLYMDMDALWIRAPGDSTTEFIGSDISDTESDHAWSLDANNTYLANGVMRFRRGRSMFREIAENSFTPSKYDPKCFNCGGPKAFTTYVKTRRSLLETNGLHILPREALYPYNWKEIVPVLRRSDRAEDEVLRIEERGLSIHLYGKVTSNSDIEEGSVVATAIKIWGLDLSPQAQSISGGPRLQGPKILYYQVPSTPIETDTRSTLLDKVPGSFKGIDAVFVRGGRSMDGYITRKASILITVKEGSVTMDSLGAGTRRIQLDLGQSITMAQLNLALSRVRYIPPSSPTWVGADQVKIQVEFGQMREQLDIPVIRRVAKAA
ncbi:hypothetical protein BGX33_005797 [Mortierella sp. NVP41]|nr:hypothetical protein BGX33_005797 [Mortierella sp. NVP41]